MGFDCTLHVVDEQQIKTAFSNRHFDPTKFNPLDWCNDAVRLAAETLPYHYERNFALALWPAVWDEVPAPAPDFPQWIDECSPAPLFETLPKELHDRIPTTFDGNFTTGIFISSVRVQEALHWVESCIRPLAPIHKKRFKGLLNILGEAQRRGLAYWEACDLGLPLARFEKNLAPDSAHIDLPAKLNSVCAWMPGSATLVLSNREPAKTLFVLLSTWPPEIVDRGDYMLSPAQDPATKVWTALVSRGGEWKLMSLESLTPAAPLQGPLFFETPKVAGSRASTDRPWFRAGELLACGPHSVLFPRENEAAVPAVRLNNQGSFRRIPGLPEPELVYTTLEPRDVTARGAVTLRNGQGVLIWGGNGYTIEDGEARPAYQLDARASSTDWSFAMLGDAGFYYLSDRKLCAVRGPGSKPDQLLPKLANIMQIADGRGDSILLREGENKQDDAVKIYTPSSRKVHHISNEQLGTRGITFAVYSQPLDSLVFVTEEGLLLRRPLDA